MALIYIDTNSYLDFYRLASAPLKAFREIDKYHSRLVLTEQTVDEFYRNRGALLRDLIQRVKDTVIEIPLIALVQEIDAVKELNALQKTAENIVNKIRVHLTAYLENDVGDPALAI